MRKGKRATHAPVNELVKHCNVTATAVDVGDTRVPQWEFNDFQRAGTGKVASATARPQRVVNIKSTVPTIKINLSKPARTWVSNGYRPMLLTPQVYALPRVFGFLLSMLTDAQMSIDSIAQSNTATASLCVLRYGRGGTNSRGFRGSHGRTHHNDGDRQGASLLACCAQGQWSRFVPSTELTA